jgi:DNA-binding SARP family transcriptional activator
MARVPARPSCAGCRGNLVPNAALEQTAWIAPDQSAWIALDPTAWMSPADAFARDLARARLRRDERASPVPLSVHTLGVTALSVGGESLQGAWLDHRPGKLLKFLLAERRRVVKVDEIGESIWPGSDYAFSANVRYYVHVLRRILEPARPARSPASLVICHAGGYALNLAMVEVDADVFESAMRAALPRVAVQPELAAPAIESALALYGGEFLADEPYASWAIAERQRLHELACEGLSALGSIRASQGHARAASEALSRLAALQPYDEDVHRRLIELDLARGRRSDALRRYSALRSRLRQAFGEEPGFTPAELSTGVSA